MHQAVHRSHSNYFGLLDVGIFARGGKKVENYAKSLHEVAGLSLLLLEDKGGLGERSQR